MAHDVFISYSHKDKTTADAICAVLEQNGIKCWYAPRDILPGKEWADAIVGAVNSSKALVLVFSEASNESRMVAREVSLAVSADIPLIPFRITDTAPTGEFTFFLHTTHWLDAYTEPLKIHIDSLLKTVFSLLNIPDKPEPMPEPRPEPRPPVPDSFSIPDSAVRFVPKGTATITMSDGTVHISPANCVLFKTPKLELNFCGEGLYPGIGEKAHSEADPNVELVYFEDMQSMAIRRSDRSGGSAYAEITTFDGEVYQKEYAYNCTLVFLTGKGKTEARLDIVREVAFDYSVTPELPVAWALLEKKDGTSFLIPTELLVSDIFVSRIGPPGTRWLDGLPLKDDAVLEFKRLKSVTIGEIIHKPEMFQPQTILKLTAQKANGDIIDGMIDERLTLRGLGKAGVFGIDLHTLHKITFLPKG